MDLAIWCSWYKEILKDFGFNREADEESAEILDNLLGDKGFLSPDEIIINKNSFFWIDFISI